MANYASPPKKSNDDLSISPPFQNENQSCQHFLTMIAPLRRTFLLVTSTFSVYHEKKSLQRNMSVYESRIKFCLPPIHIFANIPLMMNAVKSRLETTLTMSYYHDPPLAILQLHTPSTLYLLATCTKKLILSLSIYLRSKKRKKKTNPIIAIVCPVKL